MRLLGLILVMAIGSAAHAEYIKIFAQKESKASVAGANLHFVEMKKHVLPPGVTDVYTMTDTKFIYSVKDGAKLEDFAIVQFIRGCQFEEYMQGGKIVKQLTSAYHMSENPVPARYPHWQIDSDNSSPVYTAYAGNSIYSLLRWNEDGSSNIVEDFQTKDPKKRTHFYAGTRPPETATVFATDLGFPTAYDSDQKVSKSQNLQYKTCFFKVSDVPEKTDADGAGVDVKKALWCVSWDNMFRYNYRTKAVEPAKDFDPICEMDK